MNRTDEGEALREAIDAGLRAFCECTPDFTMSSAMRRSAADFIMGQPRVTQPDAIADAIPGIAAMVANIERWRETGESTGPAESKALYEGLVASLAALNTGAGRGEA